MIGDVGQDKIEEVDYEAKGAAKGANFGWSVFEGRSPYNPGSAPGAVPPVLQQTHASGWCSIVGGYVVRDASVPALRGRYVYGDLCQPHCTPRACARTWPRTGRSACGCRSSSRSGRMPPAMSTPCR